MEDPALHERKAFRQTLVIEGAELPDSGHSNVDAYDHVGYLFGVGSFQPGIADASKVEHSPIAETEVFSKAVEDPLGRRGIVTISHSSHFVD